jgi:hypothetical protein
VQVLEIDPLNVKALMRAGKISLTLDDFDASEACFQKVGG